MQMYSKAMHTVYINIYICIYMSRKLWRSNPSEFSPVEGITKHNHDHRLAAAAPTRSLSLFA